MARCHRQGTERSLRRVLPRSVLLWTSCMLALLGTACYLIYKPAYPLDPQTQTFPLNQLERGYVSRRTAVQHMNNFLRQLVVHQQSTTSLDGDRFRINQSDFSTQVSRDLETLQSLGLRTSHTELDMLLRTDVAADKTGQQGGSLNRSNNFSPQFVTHRFCYATSKTPQGNHRQVDPSFCARLTSLLNDVQRGTQPSLLTVFTWIPDPLYDPSKLRRRVLFENWSMLRPVVQPVLFTDSRVYMALANTYDWPCLPVTSYSPEGVPVFRDMASAAAGMFNSTFYGYVRATTTFDASLVETLLKVKEVYVDKFSGNWTRLTGAHLDNVHSSDSMKPVLIYGRSLRANKLGSMKSLEYLSQAINTTEGHAWLERKDAQTYFFYSNLHFSDIPDLIVDDKYLTSQLVSRSLALGHLVVDSSATLFAAHIVRGVTTSEWGREYLRAKPRDPNYNRRLGSQYFQSQGMARPGKRLNEVATRFSSSGQVFIDVRSGERVYN